MWLLHNLLERVLCFQKVFLTLSMSTTKLLSAQCTVPALLHWSEVLHQLSIPNNQSFSPKTKRKKKEKRPNPGLLNLIEEVPASSGPFQDKSFSNELFPQLHICHLIGWFVHAPENDVTWCFIRLKQFSCANSSA